MAKPTLEDGYGATGDDGQGDVDLALAAEMLPQWRSQVLRLWIEPADGSDELAHEGQLPIEVCIPGRQHGCNLRGRQSRPLRETDADLQARAAVFTARGLQVGHRPGPGGKHFAVSEQAAQAAEAPERARADIVEVAQPVHGLAECLLLKVEQAVNESTQHGQLPPSVG